MYVCLHVLTYVCIHLVRVNLCKCTYICMYIYAYIQIILTPLILEVLSSLIFVLVSETFSAESS